MKEDIIDKYRIAGNFRGRKLSRIGRKGRKLSRNAKTDRIMGVACLEFRGENFRRWLKNREICESFLSRKFPAIRYTTTFHYCHGNDSGNKNNFYYESSYSANAECPMLPVFTIVDTMMVTQGFPKLTRSYTVGRLLIA